MYVGASNPPAGPPPDYDTAVRVEVISFSTFLRQEEERQESDEEETTSPTPTFSRV